MKLERVRLQLETTDTGLLPTIKKALDDLDVLLEADLDSLNDEYRKRMGQGRVRVTYNEDGIVCDVMGVQLWVYT